MWHAFVFDVVLLTFAFWEKAFLFPDLKNADKMWALVY